MWRIHHKLKSQISYDNVLLLSIVIHRKIFPSWVHLSYILGTRFVRTKFSPKKQDSETSPFRPFHSPAVAPPAELKQASKMLGWEIPPPLEENPTHTYDSEAIGSIYTVLGSVFSAAPINQC